MKKPTNKILSLLLMVSLVITGLVVVPMTARAASNTVPIDQMDTVSTMKGNIQAAINSAGIGNTVTVTGTVTGPTTILELDIPTGVTVIWKADYSGTIDHLIELTGNGTFEVANDGKVITTGPTAILGNTGAIMVSGGEVKGTIGAAIYTVSGNVTVTSGNVKVTSGQAILTESGDVTVNDGTLSATIGNTIKTGGNNVTETDGGNVTINGGTLSTTSGYTIHTFIGDVTVCGGMVKSTSGCSVAAYGGSVSVTGGTLSTAVGEAIYTIRGNVTVAGSGKVEATDNKGIAIYVSSGNVTISGNAKVEATGNDVKAIETNNGHVTVCGGMVTTTNGCAVEICDGSISVTDGIVTSDDNAFAITDFGVAAYRKGTVSGGFDVSNDKGLIVEADTLTVPSSRNGKSDGLDVKEGKTGETSAKWDTSENKPKIVFTLSDKRTKTLEWGTKITAPGVPQSFAASVGDKQVTLKWAAPASNGGAAITKYEVSANNSGTWVTAASNTSHTFTALTNGTTYIFKVRAVNSDGNGAQASVTATPKAATISTPTPPAPVTVKVASVKTLPVLYLVKGKSDVLTAVVQPHNATDKSVTWKSKNSKIAKIDPKTGKVTGVKAGSKTILTATTNDCKKTATCTVYVVSRATKLGSFTITPNKSVGLLVGKNLQVKAKLNPVKATGIVPKYKSSNTKIAVIDQTGVITAQKAGKTTITVTAGGKKQSFTLTVGTVAVKSITLNKKTASVSKGKTVTLKVKAFTPSNTAPKTITWTTSNKTIATVTSKGVVKGVKKGKVTITATTWNGKTAKCTVTVK